MTDISYYRCRLAYEAGVKARQKGKPRSANNREPGTVYYDDWGDGWYAEDDRLARTALEKQP